MNARDVRQKVSAIRSRLMGRKTRYSNVFSTNEGEIVLAELYRYCGLGRPTYVEGYPDRTAYNEGMRRVALHIKGVLKQTDVDVDKLMEGYSKSVHYDPTNQ